MKPAGYNVLMPGMEQQQLLVSRLPVITEKCTIRAFCSLLPTALLTDATVISKINVTVGQVFKTLWY